MKLKKRYFPPLAFAFIIGSSVINLGYNFYYSHKINALLPLFEQNQYREYLAQMEPLMRSVKSKHLKYHCMLNVSAA
ncbi:MAG: hypothetical protein R3Y53_11705, partial [Bacillota bacterium]